MAKAMLQSGGCKVLGKKTKATVKKPKKLLKAAPWWIDNPEGIGLTYVDMRALLK